MKTDILRAFTVSLVISLVVGVAYIVLLADTVTLREGTVFPSDYPTWSAQKQTDWIQQHSDVSSGFDGLMVRYRESAALFWAELVHFFLPLFVVAFASCVAFALWTRKRSNPPLNRTRADVARAG